MIKLKKSLAVLLVLVMALTMVPFASANVTTVADFTDAADVTQSRDILMALDVLAAVNVLRGEGGNIYPQRTITRAEAATIVARVLLGPNSADQLPPGRTGFRDVDGVSGLAFASGAIAYLHERGIVIGVGDNLFDPQAPVTGAELAVMFLRAVGFGVNGEYTGPRWQTNAVVDGMQWRILRGDADFTAPATREQVFFYAFNAMNHRGLAVGLVYVNWSTDRNAYVPVLLQDQLQTIFSRIFVPSPINLVWNETPDMFGRPADRFTLRGQEIGLYPQEAAVTFTAFTTEANVNAAIQGINTDNAVPAFVNGTRFFTAPDADGNITFSTTASANALRGATIGRDIHRLTGNGVLVEIFVDVATNQMTAVTVIRTDISQVTRVNASAREHTFTPVTEDGENNIRTATFGSSTSLTEGPLHALFAEFNEFVVDDFVLVTPVYRNGDWEVGAIATPDTVTGTLSAAVPFTNVRNLTGSLTVGEQVYRRARILTSGAREAELTGVGNEITLILDAYGYLVHSRATAVSTRNIIILEEWDLHTLQNNVMRRMVRGFYPDGTEAELVLASGHGIPTATINSIVRSGNNITLIPINPPMPAIPATATSFATAASLPNVPPTTITSTQPTLVLQMLGGNTPVAFASNAVYFYWMPATATQPGRWAVRERDHSITAVTINANGGNAGITAIVEYRGTNARPVISALVMNWASEAALNADTLFFMRTGVQEQIIIDGLVHGLVRVYDVNGSVRNVALTSPRDGILDTSRFVEATTDSFGRFTTTDLADQIGTNLGVFSNASATRNGLASGLIVLTPNNPSVMDSAAAGATVTVNSHTMILDMRGGLPAGTAVADLVALNDLLAASADVRVSVSFNVVAGNVATALYIHSA
ncbi:MAG: S-layer homology domain-containing protein [Oscillospiraceae bacterium]|nr:S-layer homology domain-containing protein [Oscillospiraceae bacterium]